MRCPHSGYCPAVLRCRESSSRCRGTWRSGMGAGPRGWCGRRHIRHRWRLAARTHPHRTRVQRVRVELATLAATFLTSIARCDACSAALPVSWLRANSVRCNRRASAEDRPAPHASLTHRYARRPARRPRSLAHEPHGSRTPCPRHRLHHPGRPGQPTAWRTRGRDRRLSPQQVPGKDLGPAMLHSSRASGR